MKVPPSTGRLRNSLWAWAVCGAMAWAAIAAGETGEYLGPSALVVSSDAKTLYVANADARQVAWVDLSSGKVTRRVDVPAEPTGVVLSPDGAKLVVTCAAPRSTVVVIDTASGRVTATIPAGHTAIGPAITAAQRQVTLDDARAQRHRGGDHLGR